MATNGNARRPNATKGIIHPRGLERCPDLQALVLWRGSLFALPVVKHPI